MNFLPPVWGGGGGGGGSVDKVGETGSGLCNAQDGAPAGGDDSNDGDDCIRSFR